MGYAPLAICPFICLFVDLFIWIIHLSFHLPQIMRIFTDFAGPVCILHSSLTLFTIRTSILHCHPRPGPKWSPRPGPEGSPRAVTLRFSLSIALSSEQCAEDRESIVIPRERVSANRGMLSCVQVWHFDCRRRRSEEIRPMRFLGCALMHCVISTSLEIREDDTLIIPHASRRLALGKSTQNIKL